MLTDLPARPSIRRHARAAVPAAVAVAVMTLLAACGETEAAPPGPARDFDTLYAATEEAAANEIAALGLEEGVDATLPTGAVIPADAVAGASATMPDRTRALSEELLTSGDEARKLLVLRVSCFARTLTRNSDTPDIAAATEQALGSMEETQAEDIREEVTATAAALDARGRGQAWEDQLAVTSLCGAAADQEATGGEE